MHNSNKLFAAYNMFFRVFEERGRSKKFTEHNKVFEFDEDGVAYLFLSESIATVLRTAELIKNCFLFVLKTTKMRSEIGFWSKMTRGHVIWELNEITKGKSCSFTDKMDVQLRNALTHGLFWMEGIVLVYCNDITLKNQKEIIVSKLWTNARDQRKIAQCLVIFVAD